MPWVAIPYSDQARRSRLNRLYGIQEGRMFPWYPRPVLELQDSNAMQLNEGPCLVLFVVMVAAEWKMDDMSDSLRDYTNLPEAVPLLTILDMSARAKYVRDVEEITAAVVEQ
ncbi:hypothetical protein JZ751_025675, partial [Albula glossodonta]